MVQKLKMKIIKDDSDDAIIEGSNEIVMGSVEKITNMMVSGKNEDHVSHFLDVIMLGLFIIGETDNLVLNETTMLKAHQISPNLDILCDGVISMRFDENA